MKTNTALNPWILIKNFKNNKLIFTKILLWIVNEKNSILKYTDQTDQEF